MHKQQQEYINRTKKRFPDAFINKKVLNIGSFSVNGRDDVWFDNCDYKGMDLLPGTGVDIVCPANEYMAPSETFDTIVSFECWEHNPFYKESIINSIRILKSGGHFIWTCATTGRPIHGTATQDAIDRAKGKTLQGNKITEWKTMPNVEKSDWDNNYYKNVTIQDILDCIDPVSIFLSFSFEHCGEHCDLYFEGIKK